MTQKKIRIKIGDKLNFGTKEKCEAKLNKLASNFVESRLNRFGLKRDEATFNDLMTGGKAALRYYRENLERELPVNSVVPYIAERAQDEVEEAIGELSRYISTYSAISGENLGSGTIRLKPEHVRYDESSGKVVLTDSGKEAVEDELCYFLTSQRQIDAYNLANKMVEDWKQLKEYTKGITWLHAIDDGRNGILRYDNIKGLEVLAENIVKL